ncbi:phosphotransferase enzyme family protein [bacterium BMS3Abin02]|nr:phosphotransferase enzyme family protein [bacterium BMS3Abin02]GBE21408.1 phosphotransferase enzyme family protein [bacterium BMS3Bbin01]
MADVQAWFRQIVDPRCDVTAMVQVGGGSGCSVARCRVRTRAGEKDLHIKIYKRGMDDYSGLGPIDTARKHSLALVEVPRFGIRVPQVIGMKASGGEAAIVSETVGGGDWAHSARLRAAGALSRLHRIRPSDLSGDLQTLVRRSRPNRDRIVRGIAEYSGQLNLRHPGWHLERADLAQEARGVLASEEPDCSSPTLVHGDFFSRNLLAVDGGVVVIDWDLLALGDPVWDLGHLLCADRCVAGDERREVLASYGAGVAQDRLRWHEAAWTAFWDLRDLLELS